MLIVSLAKLRSKKSLSQREEFSKIIEENKGIIYKISNAYSKNPDDRKDISQEIIIQIWKSFPRYNKKYKISTWIYRIALNVAISWFRKSSKLKGKIVTLEEDTAFSINDDSQDDLKDKINRLHQIINRLSELDKGLMLLYLDEISYEEIAEIMGISLTNVATKISRIKKKLKQEFLKLNRDI